MYVSYTVNAKGDSGWSACGWEDVFGVAYCEQCVFAGLQAYAGCGLFPEEVRVPAAEAAVPDVVSVLGHRGPGLQHEPGALFLRELERLRDRVRRVGAELPERAAALAERGAREGALAAESSDRFGVQQDGPARREAFVRREDAIHTRQARIRRRAAGQRDDRRGGG